MPLLWATLLLLYTVHWSETACRPKSAMSPPEQVLQLYPDVACSPEGRARQQMSAPGQCAKATNPGRTPTHTSRIRSCIALRMARCCHSRTPTLTLTPNLTLTLTTNLTLTSNSTAGAATVPVPGGRQQFLRRPREPGAGAGRRRRAEDEADAALGRGPAQPGPEPGAPGLPLQRPPAAVRAREAGEKFSARPCSETPV